MLKCVRMTIIRFYTVRFDDQEEEDQKFIDLDGDELKQALVDHITEEGDDSLLCEDEELDIEPQDISIIETYYV